MNVEELIARATSATGHKTRYVLGAGGKDPTAAHPWNDQGECDCSGFLAWALGLPRRLDHPLYTKLNGGWLETSAIVTDARVDSGYFARTATPMAGAILAYPDYHDAKGARHEGHCALVVEAGSDLSSTRILHCSSRNGQAGDAIAVTKATVFARPDAIVCWYVGVDAP